MGAKEFIIMKVTVAIPCYNGAEFVGAAIESVLEQTRPADEILIIDDGSTDNSVAIIQQYPVTLVEHVQNKGLATARNTAVSQASSDILIYVDVDATADPTLIETLLSGYTSDQIGGVGGQGIESSIHNLADRWRRAHATQGHGNQPKQVKHLYGLCMSYRVSVLKEINGFNTQFLTNAEDVEIGLRVNEAGYQLQYLPNAKVYHKRTDTIDSLKRTMRNWYYAGYLAQKLNNSGLFRAYAGVIKRLFTDPIQDLLIHKDIEMAKLSWQIGLIKLDAFQEARRASL